MRAWLLGLFAAVASASAWSQPLSVGFGSPTTVANDPVAITVFVDDTSFLHVGGGDGAAVSVTMGGLSTSLVQGSVSRNFKPPCCYPAWVGSLAVSSLAEGTYDITATATNSTGQTFSATRTVTLDRRPAIEVQQPPWSAATWLQVPVSATCSDSQGCTSFTAYPNAGGPWALAGTSTLSGLLDVSGFDGYGLQFPFVIDFTATDPSGQQSRRSVRVYPEGSPHVRAVATVPGRILDADSTRFLYVDEPGRLFIRNRASGVDTLIHSATEVLRAGLTDAGAVFSIHFGAGVSDYATKSWENGALVTIGGNTCCFLSTNGRYAIWSEFVSGSTRLFWRDVVANETREISPVLYTYGASPSLTAGGAVAYWQGGGPGPWDLRLYDPQATPDTRVIVPPSTCVGPQPRTDGTTVVFVRSGCGVPNAVYAWKDGVTRTVLALSAAASYDVADGWIGVVTGSTAYRFDPQGLSTPIPMPPNQFPPVDRIGPQGTLVLGDGTYARLVSAPGENEARRSASPASQTLFIGGALHFALGNTLFAYDRATPKVSTLAHQFGSASMGTVTDPPRTVTLTNDSASTVTIDAVAPSTNFRTVHDCSSLAPGGSCTVQVAFAPGPAPVALNAAQGMPGTVSITSTGATRPIQIALFGIGERSLVRHYYQTILGRQPDTSGKAFWESEATRMFTLGADLNEAWYAMAMAFFTSPEYLSTGRGNAAFAQNLYRTFFSRDPDAGGLSYWTGQLDQGLPREVALAAFMFSGEFTGLTRSIYGSTTTRPEVDMVVDFYRGLLGRLPDSTGFNHWLGRFRAAQCQGAAAVYAEVETISSAFVGSAEYSGRQRSNPGYVGDLYNAFLRRGGDLAGVRFWIDQLNAGRAREELRRDFIGSPEFSARVRAIVDQGCAS